MRVRRSKVVPPGPFEGCYFGGEDVGVGSADVAAVQMGGQCCGVGEGGAVCWVFDPVEAGGVGDWGRVVVVGDQQGLAGEGVHQATPLPQTETTNASRSVRSMRHNDPTR